ncbi:MAG TPA: GNAT family N-acetyltransferase, partial [Actinomycetota bacterium]
MAVRIREATVADARAIAEVHVEGWAWGYRGLLPDDVIAARDVQTREAQWLQGFTDDWHDGDACFVAVDGDRVVGFVACGPAADEHVAPPDGSGEIYSIYLRDGVQGTGVGRGLFAKAEEAMRSNGFEHAVLWVLGSNDRSRRFYEKAGWRWDGTVSEHRFDCANLP